MRRSFFCLAHIIVVGIITCIATSILLPSFSHASELSAEFFVSAWLVRIWLAMVSGAVIIGGLMIALDGYASDHRLEPVITEETNVSITRVREISYRKIGSGLLLVIFGCLFFVTSIFLLPDKRSGHSGINTIIDHFKADSASETVITVGDHGKSPAKH
ncbi:hypothetical protein ACFLYW_03715 [Thermodesulfobacteriota bacterium]